MFQLLRHFPDRIKSGCVESEPWENVKELLCQYQSLAWSKPLPAQHIQNSNTSNSKWYTLDCNSLYMNLGFPEAGCNLWQLKSFVNDLRLRVWTSYLPIHQIMGYLRDVKFGKRALTKEENLNEGKDKTNTIGIICAGVGSPPELGSSRMFLTCNPPAGKITHVHQK